MLLTSLVALQSCWLEMVSPCPSSPRLPRISGLAVHERKRKVAVKCLELEEMLESQG